VCVCVQYNDMIIQEEYIILCRKVKVWSTIRAHK